MEAYRVGCQADPGRDSQRGSSGPPLYRSSHTVDTVTAVGVNETTSRERETSVFLRDGDRIFAVYEGRSIPGMHLLTDRLAAYCF
jgi:hypothetical protein